MLTYFVSQSNSYSFRTDVTSSNEFTMSLQDMTTLTNTTASLSGITYDGYESVLSFTASISESIIGEEYRAKPIIGGEFVKEIIFAKKYGNISSSSIINGTHKT